MSDPKHKDDGLDADHETVWLQPRCCVDERAWCATDPGSCDDCGLPSIKYIRESKRKVRR